MEKNKILLIGVDAADWKVLNPMIDEGLLPTFQKIIEEGTSGNIMTLDPPLSPMLWTSIVTGKRADKHGILGFLELDPISASVRNISSGSRKTRTIWNILHYAGYRQVVVNWWPSHPVEPIRGYMVSHHFNTPIMRPGELWKVPAHSVHPREMVAELSSLRIHPAELSDQHILPFIPMAHKVNQEETNSIDALAKIIAENSTTHAIATYLMDKEPWDFVAIYFDLIDHLGHGFMRFHPPRHPSVRIEDFEIYKDVIRSGYRFFDMMLEQYLKRVDNNTLLVIVSDHGMYSDILRPMRLPKFKAAPALEHRALGMVCFYGKGIKRDERVYGATLLDIAPTLLAYAGIPIGKDMDGRVLMEIFEHPPRVDYIDSWDQVAGDFAELPEHFRWTDENPIEAIEQLVALGYIEKPDEDAIKARKKIWIENQFNLARVYISKFEYDKAKQILEELVKDELATIDIHLTLFQVYLSIDPNKANDILERISKIVDDETASMLNFSLMKAKVYMAQNNLIAAETILLDMIKNKNFTPSTLRESGKLLFQTGRFNDSIKAYQYALELNSDDPLALFGLAQNYFMLGWYEEASDYCLDALGILYYFPQAHYLLGRSLMELGRYEEAAKALEKFVSMLPTHVSARSFLIKIYRDLLHKPEMCEMHQKYVEGFFKGRIVVVSGLPRSGTSLMMQMLEAGGMRILTDNLRKPDEHNPRGYYEYEPVKNLHKDNSFMKEAIGKAVKIIAQLLPYIPLDYKYKIIFMHRDMNEILQSQQKMLGRDPSIFPSGLANIFQKQLQVVDNWIKEHPEFEILHVNHQDVIKQPFAVASKINEFLDYSLDTYNMIKVVDPNLYRNKAI
ncbi:MAG: alkaline phosphatase family protein [Bacteroidales bacterium]|nr:alkaline phosphatase family protein [Bacteroidales bacterium]